MATKNNVPKEDAVTDAAPAVAEPAPVKKLYVQSVVGRMLDTTTNKEVNEPAFHENTLWLQSQMAAGKVVEVSTGE